MDRAERRLLALVLLAVALWLAKPLPGHEAPSGWQYSAGCCHNQDCAWVEFGGVTAGADGYRVSIPPHGHPMVGREGFEAVVPYGHRKIRQSGDTEFHVCLRKMAPAVALDRVICLYVPHTPG